MERKKYNNLTKLFLRRAEKLAVKNAQILVADSPSMRQYLWEKHNKEAVYIPYGATVFINPNSLFLKNYDLEPNQYFLVVARMEPENNIEMIIKGYLASNQKYPLFIVGNHKNTHGKYLASQYKHPKIKFSGAIFEHDIINNIRHYSSLYLHGHSVGGTNPSLLEAMACNCNIIAHNNIFNKTVLGEGAEFFSSEKEITAIINRFVDCNAVNQRKEINLAKIKSIYCWPKVINCYEEVMLHSLAISR